ncbi:D-alanine--D-alanine ligase family protein [Parenemella sanctibonifatiensis]|uniref:D-alanine--D-alanine ligase n=1 Tax=Parenemella sanctibonifatiensis TaxID=2016505 RepID=A0A255EJ55_9ACTN|nr:D-alanine--D-alanine ligase family protein [Parenemella sanctibonifatiensis]OYN91270.1 D-alanine--D-alanine ligase A [Parenemella sanctibonifatiensis]
MSADTTSASRPTTVLLVCGGAAGEHSVSCLTAAGVLGAMDHERYHVIPVGITTGGSWLRLSIEEVTAFRASGDELPSVDAIAQGHDEALLHRDGEDVLLATRQGSTLADPVRIDVAFALLHGPMGEDGTIQGLFELMRLRYVGCGVMASAVALDKDATHRMLLGAGLPMVPYTALSQADWTVSRRSSLDAIAALGLPVFVKPARGGSSVGISKVSVAEDLPAALDEAFTWGAKVIVEQGLENAREVECAVLQDPRQGLRTASVGEIVMEGTEFYDFTTKYLGNGKARMQVPADLTSDQAAEIDRLARRAFVALGCEGLARVDFFLTEKGRLLLNEVNTMPGFTEFSMYPYAWGQSGLAYADLIDLLIEQALQREAGPR